MGLWRSNERSGARNFVRYCESLTRLNHLEREVAESENKKPRRSVDHNWPVCDGAQPRWGWGATYSARLFYNVVWECVGFKAVRDV